MTRESDLFILFGKESLDLVPLAWKELHERYPTTEELEAFLAGNADEPYQYRPSKWYHYLPKPGTYYTRDVDTDSIQQWIWYFPGDRFTDCQVGMALAKALKWSVNRGVSSITLTFPPVPRNARKPLWWASARSRRTMRIMASMRLAELETGILVGMVTKRRGFKDA